MIELDASAFGDCFEKEAVLKTIKRVAKRIFTPMKTEGMEEMAKKRFAASQDNPLVRDASERVIKYRGRLDDLSAAHGGKYEALLGAEKMVKQKSVGPSFIEKATGMGRRKRVVGMRQARLERAAANRQLSLSTLKKGHYSKKLKAAEGALSEAQAPAKELFDREMSEVGKRNAINTITRIGVVGGPLSVGAGYGLNRLEQSKTKRDQQEQMQRRRQMAMMRMRSRY